MTDFQLQQKRLIAAAVDGALLTAFAMLMGAVAGALNCAGAAGGDYLTSYGVPLLVVGLASASLLFVLGRDVIAGDRSVGKKLMGLRIVTLTGAPVGLLESVKRNALFAPPFALWVLSAFIELLPLGSCVSCLLLPLHLLAGLAALVAVIWELIQIVQQPDGARVGDNMAGTRVVL